MREALGGWVFLIIMKFEFFDPTHHRYEAIVIQGPASHFCYVGDPEKLRKMLLLQQEETYVL